MSQPKSLTDSHYPGGGHKKLTQEILLHLRASLPDWIWRMYLPWRPVLPQLPSRNDLLFFSRHRLCHYISLGHSLDHAPFHRLDLKAPLSTSSTNHRKMFALRRHSYLSKASVFRQTISKVEKVAKSILSFYLRPLQPWYVVSTLTTTDDNYHSIPFSFRLITSVKSF